MKRIASIILIIMFSFVFIFATACGEEEDQTENISINIAVQEDSYDLMYLYDVAYEFAEKYSQKQYSYQKKGVYVDVCLVPERNFMLDLQEYEDYDIYLTNQTIGHHIYKWANRGWLLSMDDVFYSKTIDEYGIDFTQTSLAKNSEQLSKLPEGTVLCLLRPYIVGNISKGETYSQLVSAFVQMAKE